MAIWDSADLLARCIRLAGRPANDTATATADWYAMLTEAQAYWTGVFAAQAPYVLMGAPQLLTTADSGVTYTFPSSIYPLAVEVYDTINPGRLLKPAAFWDTNGDYVWEGNLIRMPQNTPQTFSNGPYARYVSPPGTLDGSTAPTLMPPHTRILLVYRTVAEWANRGGLRDPRPFYEMEQRAWLGNPASGDVGILGMLKTQNALYGATAISDSIGGLVDGVDTGAGYSKVSLGGG